MLRPIGLLFWMSSLPLNTEIQLFSSWMQLEKNGNLDARIIFLRQEEEDNMMETLPVCVCRVTESCLTLRDPMDCK